MTIKLNCDMGESFGHWQLGDDALVMPCIDQANIACGYHAGDPVVAKQTLSLAIENEVSLGAHPSYPDLLGFGRRSMACSRDELIALVQYQVSALDGMARAQGSKLDYVKPHGALYNDMMNDATIRDNILTAIADLSPQLKLMLLGTTDAELHKTEAAQHGVELIFEGFADRRYTDKGHLQARSEPGSVLDHDAMIAQVTQIATTSTIMSVNNKRLKIPLDSLCVHGDNKEGVKAISEIKQLLQHHSSSANSQ